MKKILIGGYYGYGNIGDEAILEAFAQRLAAYPDVDITVLSSNPGYTFKTQGLKAVSRNNPISVTKSFIGCDLFVQGGGGIIQDSTSWRSPFFYLGQLLLSHILARKIYIMGQGIGPLNGSFARFLTRDLFATAEAIVVRDLSSQTFLMEALPTDFDISLATDVALMLDAAPDHVAEDILYDEGLPDLPEPVLIVSIKGNHKNMKSIGHYVTAINTYLDEAGGSALFVPFFPQYDMAFARKIMSAIKGNTGLIKKQYKPSEILSLFKTADHILAGRLHAAMFAALAETSFTTVVYDPKMKYFLDMIDIKSTIVTPIIGPKSIEEALFNDIDDSESIVDRIKKRLPPLIKQAESNISKLLELLDIG